MKNNYHTSVILFFIRLVLGVTFIYASYHKIADPGTFAKIIYGYGVFPGFSINILAITIPFIELTAGFSLILGLFPRSALLIINALLLCFILVIGFNLLRGHEFDCGCFSFSNHSHRFANIDLLIRDMVMLGAGLYAWQKTKVKTKVRLRAS
jgi:uncharacterized membrane protein YphA (DoxX/SURF4 family)